MNKPILKLKDLISQGEAALATFSPTLGQKMFQLDCSEIDSLTPTQISALFTAIPEIWDFNDIADIFILETLSQNLCQQIETIYPLKNEFQKDLIENTETALEINNNIHPIKILDKVISEYRDYLLTEFRAKDPQLKQALEQAIDQPKFLAQATFYQAHRPFKSGKAWQELPLDRRLAQVMENRSNNQYAYLHQSQAIIHLLGENPSPLVVTTGTGSGKTETFLLPVIQNAIADAITYKKSGLTAILVYPMNALANDQLKRIEDYLSESGWAGAISIAKYDRSTKQKERELLRQNPPHILLTNYMMLEYLLVRPADRDNIFANHRCRFLVLDEVHTYRGTLGSNIALLIRRLKAHLQMAKQDYRTDENLKLRYPQLIPIGTSATIKNINDETLNPSEQLRLRDEAIQDYFSKITGAEPNTIRVITEELEEINIPPQAAYPDKPPIIPEIEINNPHSVGQALLTLSGQPPNHSIEEAIQHCRLLWDLNRWLIRTPLSIEQIANKIKTEVHQRQHISTLAIEREVEAALVIGAALPESTLGALRLRSHRLIRGGWYFHRCLNPNCGKLYPMGEQKCECGYNTAPLYLCRNCGAHYLRLMGDSPVDPSLAPLRPSDDLTTEHEWMLYEPQRFETNAIIEEEEEEDPLTTPRTRKNRRQTQQIRHRPICSGSFNPKQGIFSFDPTHYTLPVTLSPARTRCLCCGGTAGNRNVLTPVALGTSAAVKVLGEGLIEALATVHKNHPTHDGKERLLVFSDSRQDAAHQARFIHFASRYDRMRRRVIQLLQQQNDNTLRLQRTIELLSELAVKEKDNPEVPPQQKRISRETLNRIQAWEEAPLLDEISLNAGYRATLLNLGLIHIEYHELSDYILKYGQPLAAQLSINLEQLEYICRCILDEIRVRGCLSRELLCYHPDYPSCPDYLKAANWERRVKNPQGYALSEDKNPLPLSFLDKATVPEGINAYNALRKPKAGGRSPSLERILNHLLSRFQGIEAITDKQMVALLSFLMEGTYLIPSELYGYREKKSLLQVNANEIVFNLTLESERLHCQVCGTVVSGAKIGSPCPQCHGQLIQWTDAQIGENRTVRRILSQSIIPLYAKEHTAQIPNDERIQIEIDFKAPTEESPINLLACSPTLEMGIDVGGLDAVILRNIPPRPDNYAQRGGRAGRRTRVGLVISYARSTPHDQYFYEYPAEMISGEVPTPAIALGNRDVIFRHLYAIAFGAATPGLSSRMLDYVSPNGMINQEAVDALITGVQAQFSYAIALARQAWEPKILQEATLDEKQLELALNQLPERIQDIINRTARQVIELRQALNIYSEQLQGRGAAIRSGDLISRILGISSEQNQDGDDRSAGYPLRRFAEFGILPGYEFPTQPATLRLWGDQHEDDPITTSRILGINQFRPDALVYARTRRWKVMGLDNASPWNPQTGEPTWLYRLCRTCGLRYDAHEPFCPRCHSDNIGQNIAATEFAGFLARAYEGPILDEEERYAARNLVTIQPQWNGQIIGRWKVAPGWSLCLSRDEKVVWLNEGLPPTPQDMENQIPTLHPQAKGYLICPSCGRTLNNPEPEATRTNNRRRTRNSSGQRDVYGHSEQCPRRGMSPTSIAIVTEEKAEVLRLLIPLPASINNGSITTWGISLGYALMAGMQHCYMLDGSEIVFNFEGPWKTSFKNRSYQLVALSFIDPSLGGSGYLKRIAEEFHRVADHALIHLNHDSCETACYRCLKTYQNQRYHDILNWTLAEPALLQLKSSSPETQPTQLDDLDDPMPWLEAYSAGVGSPLELKFLQLFEQYGFFPEKQVPISLNEGEPPISIADFAVVDQRLAIYIDGAAFHQGANLRRDRALRQKLRDSNPSWTVIELTYTDLKRGKNLVEKLR